MSEKHYLIQITGKDGQRLGILKDGTIECDSKQAAIAAAAEIRNLITDRAARIQVLEKALAIHGVHFKDCKAVPCTCGYLDALGPIGEGA